MGYYARTVYTQINIVKNRFPLIEKRFKEQLKEQCPVGKAGNTWLEYRYGASEFYLQKAQDGFDVEEIFSSFGFEPGFNKDGNIETLHYDDSSWDESNNKFILNLLEGLVNDGDYLEWLGSEGDDNRWINIHKGGKWETHDGQVEVKYSSDVWETKPEAAAHYIMTSLIPKEKQYIRCSKCSCTELHHEEVS